MKIDNPFEPRQRRSYVIVDLESAVLDESGHQRYRAMERWVPGSLGRMTAKAVAATPALNAR